MYKVLNGKIEGIIRLEDILAHDAFKHILRQLQPTNLEVSEESIASIEEICEKQPISVTLTFERNRNRFKTQLQTISQFLWAHFGLPKEGIIEYGSGATGFYNRTLRPEGVENWMQIEINPAAIAENMKRNPDARIIKGSYNNIRYRGVPMITGLSSFDTAPDMDFALSQVSEALGKGGYFFHIQDVRPGVHCVVNNLRKQNGYPTIGLYIVQEDVFVGVDMNGTPLTSPEAFKQIIGFAVDRNPQLELVCNQYVTLSEESPQNLLYQSNLVLAGFLPQGKRETTVHVLLAKKVA